MSPVSRRVLALAALVAALAPLTAQSKKPLTHDDYDQWKSLRGNAYSQDGNWVAYQIEPQWGDGVLEVRSTTGDTVYREERGSGARFSADGRFLVFTVQKSKVEERDKKIADLRKKKEAGKAGASKEGGEEKAAGEEPAGEAGPAQRPGGFGGRRGPGGAGAPGAGPGGRGFPGAGGEGGGRGELAILDLATGKVEKLGAVKGFTVSDDLPFLLYQPEKKADEKKADEKKTEEKEGAEKEGAEKTGGEKAGAEKTGEPAAEKKAEPAAAEPAAAEPPTPPAGEGGRGRFGQGRRGAGGRPGAGGASAEPTDPLEKKRAEGSDLVLRDLRTGEERKIADVAAYGTSRLGRWLWYHTSAKKPAKDKQYGLYAEPLAGGEAIQLLDGVCNVRSVTFTRDEAGLAFASDKTDFAADKPRFDIYLWNGQHQPAQCIVHNGQQGLPADMRIGSSLSFSRDGTVLQFRLDAPPADELLPILPEDKVSADIWNWRDGQLQTVQQKRGGAARDRSRTALFHRDHERVVVLDDDRLAQARLLGPDGSRLIASDSSPYEKEVSWDGTYTDVYLVNAFDGSSQRLLEHFRGNVSNSPGGRYLLWFGGDFHWWSYDVASGERRDLTARLAVPFHDHGDDHPEPGRAYGIAGWTDDDGAVLLNDEFDVWKVSPATGEAVCVTDGYGRANHVQLRLQRLPRSDADDSPYVDRDLWLEGVDQDSRAEGVYTDVLDRVQKPVRVFGIDKALAGLTRPQESDRFFFTLSTFDEFPDLWTANADFTGLRRLSDANPQQKDYSWGKAELVHWVDGDGHDDSGILIKPEGFDPAKKYPMMVYFYEEMTQGLNNYVAPSPGTSPNAAYYVSNGYLWFMPDVHYEIGYPGMSCVKCVVSGVQHLIAQGFVDPKAIGAAGHSWGGYQTAFLVTRTNIFAAVESGAPVSNMISAYGGIRYESGMSRQFQYEKTQSRIGGTPWEYPMRYWENSPIFFADKVQTPVLILHNDNDGAVPWTQGIEYFTALRRLGKECYLVNYNGEPHGLRQRQNMKDWSRRMSEYFDHHLRHAPAPKWMTDGVPYAERDAEKLPHAQSYIDAYVKPAPAKPAAAEATTEKATGAGATGSGDKGEPGPKAPSGKPEGEKPERGEKAEHGEKPEKSEKLEKGAPAPDFAARDEAGEEHTLAALRGHKVLLWFYPKANTPG